MTVGAFLEQLKKDLEFAYEWVPEKVDRGRTSKAACGVLLMKVAMCLGDFDRAIEIGKEIVANHPLMTARFTSNKNKPNTNLMHDLHSVEAKMGHVEHRRFDVCRVLSGRGRS